VTGPAGDVHPAPDPDLADLSAASRRHLLLVARLAIEAGLTGRSLTPTGGNHELDRPRGAFVTLRRADGQLRGCVGHVQPEHPLVETVARSAVAAAFSDGRFPPVTLDELPQVRVEISVLGPTGLIAAEDVEVGSHGLMIQHDGCSGLLLPQVAVDHGWDRETFLDYVCRKAGLGPGRWREPGCEIHAFRAVVFGDSAADG
jgi:AmmeMemoRadiSam system protein A